MANTRTPFEQWEVRAHFDPAVVSQAWVSFYVGPINTTPNATRESVTQLRLLADDIERCLNEKDAHDKAVAITAAKAHLFPEGLVPQPGEELVIDLLNPEEEAALDALGSHLAAKGPQEVQSGE
jgi:hypothetical protein